MTLHAEIKINDKPLLAIEVHNRGVTQDSAMTRYEWVADNGRSGFLNYQRPLGAPGLAAAALAAFCEES